MSGSLRWLSKHMIRLVVYGSFGAALVLLVAAVFYLDSREDLSPWHTEILDLEFQANSDVDSLQQYLALEEQLFAQLDAVLRTEPVSPADRLNRFRPGSLSDPDRWSPNGNRTFILDAPDPPAAALLLHGMSDSPYSLRSVAEALNNAGVFVIGLRLPGHGTAPSGLVEVSWQDMAAAVQLAAKHIGQRFPDRPLYLVGYSNGGALAVNYTLSAVTDPNLPRPSKLVLLSPEIGITGAAALAVWQARLGHWLGLDKLAWTDILPEYDPFKYNSFAVNAGDVAHRLTHEIQRQLDQLPADDLRQLPPIQAFTSVVDATVSAPALVDNLFNRLPPGNSHQLVVYDINHRAGMEPLLKWRPTQIVDALKRQSGNAYVLTVITNNTEGRMLLERTYHSDSGPIDRPIEIAWPTDVYSLSHVALPFPPDDPLYGGLATEPSPGIALGTIALRGERGVLNVGADAMLRLRWNPFHTYQQQQIHAFLELGEL